jgi:hypothetical protein
MRYDSTSAHDRAIHTPSPGPELPATVRGGSHERGINAIGVRAAADAESVTVLSMSKRKIGRGESEGGGLVTGPEGETIFSGHETQGFAMLRRDPDELMLLLRKIEAATDDRLYALMGALIMENRLEKLMRAWLPDLDLDDQAFTTSVRLKMLRGAQLIPLHVVKAANVVREVRNAFAHDLELETFDALPVSKRDRIKACHLDAYGSDAADATPLRKQYRATVLVAVFGFDMFTPAIAWLHETLKSSQFRDSAKAESKRILDAVFNR